MTDQADIGSTYRAGFASISRMVALAPDMDSKRRAWCNGLHEALNSWNGIARNDIIDQCYEVAEAHNLVEHFGADAIQANIAAEVMKANGDGNKFPDVGNTADAPKERKAKGDGQDQHRALRYVLFDDIENVPKVWLVENFLGVGEISCWYGEPGSGKSVLAEDLGLHVAAGFSTWLDRELLSHGAVVYVALERPHLVKRRALAFKIKHNARGLPFAIVDEAHDFRTPKTAELILQTVAEIERKTGQNVALIIADTISRALCGGDENSPKDMGALVATLGLIQAGCSAHLLLTHHVPHDVDRMRGHGSLLGAMDTTAFIQKGAGARTATVVKANDSDEGERVSFTLESVELCAVAERITTAPVVVPSAADPTMGASGATKSARKLNANQQRFFDIVQTAILEAPTDLKGIASVPLGMQAVTRDMLKRYLVANGWIEEADSGAARATISNMINSLAGKRVVGATKQHVWVVQ